MAANSSLVTRALVFLVVFVLAVFHTSSETGIFGMQGAEKRTFFNEQKNYALGINVTYYFFVYINVSVILPC